MTVKEAENKVEEVQPKKVKSSLQEENEELKALLEKLQAENDTLKAVTKAPEAQEGHTFIYVSSIGIETVPEKDAKGNITKYVRGDINGIPYKVPCDRQVEVKQDVADVLQGLIQHQRKK